MELSTDTLLYGGVGAGAGFVIGWLLKKTLKLLFKLVLVVISLFVFGLVYLQNIKVIAINEKAMDNLLDNSFNTANQMMGTTCDAGKVVNHSGIGDLMSSECLNNATMPIQNVLLSLGFPLSTGLGAGILLGWIRG